MPYFPRLRFYPIPLEQPRSFGSRVHLQDVGTTLADLRRIEPNKRILAQKEAVEVWLPLHDRIVALFLETVENGWPCQKYPDAWPERALALLGEYAELRKEHRYCGKIERAKEHSAQLREFLDRCARKPDGLTGREVGRIRLILNRYVAKRGAPDSPTCTGARRRQAADVSAPTFYAIAGVVAARLEKHSKDDGLDDVGPLNGAVTAQEAGSGMPEGTSVPPSIQRKVERCLNETVDSLIERGLITSGETLARCLPQMTSGIRALGITEPTLRQLYAAIYRAFRRRRSLLLVNLEKQVQIEELPWVAVIERFRSDSLSDRELARQTLEEVAVLTLTSFPHAILPNKLLQDLRALVTSAGLEIPLVDELAADIFMGEFSGKFVESALKAADLLQGSLYAAYYGIDYEEVRRIPKPKETTKRTWFWPTTKATPKEFVRLCASRAGVSLGTYHPATNGMIIEQQQILTTQNLAALFAGLDLADALRGQLCEMAKRCFEWVCKRQQAREDKWHAKLKMLKTTAYAWRQMLFFLTLLPDRDVAGFLRWAEGHLDAQEEGFRKRFAPALRGLVLVANGASIDQGPARKPDACRFLGWSNEKHWLLADEERREKERWTEGTMIDHIKHILSGLKSKYPITDTWSGEKGEFKVSGIDDTFYFDFLSNDHCILFNEESWHEHFIEQLGEPYGRGGHFSLEDFLDGLFSGAIRVKVKYRGNTPVAHQVGVLRDGRIETIRWTRMLRLKSLFQKRWYKELDYNLANKTSNVTAK